jgi:hypothetical protein
MQFLGPMLNACSVSILFPDWLASFDSAKNRSGRKAQGSAQLSLLWFMDHCWTSTKVCVWIQYESVYDTVTGSKLKQPYSPHQEHNGAQSGHLSEARPSQGSKSQEDIDEVTR